MQPKALSSDGYIINQDLVSDIPYGRLSSDINGCGWIAAYNFCKAMGRPQNELVLSRLLAAGSPFNAALGTGPKRLKHFLQNMGFTLKTTTSHRKAVLLGQKARAGILLFFGAKINVHYVTLISCGDGRFRVLNAVYGQEDHYTTLDEFFEQYAKFPFIYLMTAQ